MLESTFLLLAIMLLGYLFRHRWSGNQRHKETRTKTVSAKILPFRAVSIECLGFPCKAVSKLSNKRFLPNDAPSLPLATCNNASCKCRYIHHEDRRAHNSDRRLKIGIVTDLYGTLGEKERRQKTADRRIQEINTPELK
ncbi:hypothetical protein J3L11_09525 [Shewanella sp. 4t3-1-2LB]|uniref:hypothetical protein n=1 Tax=Shewanella sp. 4t3-1-2LB TaxID=2817682 RepID=UPI001A999668|nr:hypothetical protein [Shewanella sp. 4t3-1-2LB]MBO1271877.1 hypothetical protein [Shewanella sp. 4t3-1-2LB]